MTVNLSALAGAGQQFLDANGNPLTGGKLYSYEAGTTTPQVTYTTAAGNVPHANPIILDSAGRVPGGQIWLSIGLNYKFVLTSSTDTLIGTWDNITGINGTGINTNASLIAYEPAGAGAVTTTVQAKLRETVSPEDFGAVGDGLVDDSTAVKNAIQYCSDTGTPFKANGGATYRIAVSITITRTSASKPLLVDWAGATVVCDEASGVIFGGAPSAFLSTTLATEIDRGDAFIHLTSVSGLAKGDLLEILSPALTGGSISTYHYYIVNEIDGNNVYIEGTTVADVKAQQIIDSGQTGSITVAAYKVAPMLVVQNANFEMVNTTGASYFSIYVRGHNKAIVNNVTFTGQGRFQLGSEYNGFVDVGGCTFRDFGYVEKNSGYTNLPSAPSGLSFGYGFLITRTFQVLFHDCFGLRGWHTIDASRGTMHTQVSNCFFDRNSFGVSSHQGSWYVIVKDCVFDGNNGITTGRNIYSVIENCQFRNLSEHGIIYGGEMVEIRVANNRFAYNPSVVSTFSAIRNADDLSPTNPKAGAVSTGFQRVFEMIGNTVLGNCRCQAGFSNDLSNSGKLVVADNAFDNVTIFTVNSMQFTTITGNSSSRIGQFMFTLAVADGHSVVCSGNTHTGGVSTYGGSAMIGLSGSGTPILHFENNSTLTQYLLRFDSNLTVANVINCAGRAERLFQNAGTVTNAINNYFNSTISDGVTTVTNSVNNQNLA